MPVLCQDEPKMIVLFRNLKSNAMHVQAFLILPKTYVHVITVTNKSMSSAGIIVQAVLNVARKSFLAFMNIHMNCQVTLIYINEKVYNPYSSSNLTQLIREILEKEEINKHSSDAAEIIMNCKYKQSNYLTTASDDFELSILLLNIRTLLNKIENMRDDISLYENLMSYF